MVQSVKPGALQRCVPWAVAFGVVAVAAWLARLCFWAPDIRFLAPYPGAEWIVFPKPAAFDARPDVPLTTTFWKRWTLPQAPGHAELHYRAFTRAIVRVNGREFPTPGNAEADWKSPVRLDIASALRAGANEIEITVINQRGPPALWATLDAGALRTGSDWDSSYAGSSWRAARLATDPLPPARDGISAAYADFGNAWAAEWPLVVALTAFVLVGGWLWSKWASVARLRSGWAIALSADPAVVTLCVAMLGWTLLFVHNSPLLPLPFGFDATSHIGYIRFILERHALPFASDGMVMYNPPLYYALSAGLLQVLSIPLTEHAAADALRAMALVGGLTQLVLIAASLRLLFPDNRRTQALGIAFAAALPANVYVSHYVTNEWLVGVLVTATLYATLRVMRAPKATVAGCAVIGVLLGAALLTKVTALLATPFIIGALALKLWREDRTSWRAAVGRLALLTAVALVVCGWNYLRVWIHFGKPLVASWDRESGLAWWQDQGYVTISQFLRFGHVLANPVFTARTGLFDGVYSTTWGDALCGGMANPEVRPPWNYPLMSLGMTLALPLTVLLMMGVVAAARTFLRTLTPVGLIVNGILFSFAGAFVVMYFKVPCYGELKAFYGLIALLPLTIALTDLLSRGWLGRGLAARTIEVYVAVCALTTFATYWIKPDGSQTQFLLGVEAMDARNPAAAEQHFVAALRADPTSDFVWAPLATARAQLGHAAAARDTLPTALRLRPASIRLQAETAMRVASPEAAVTALQALGPALAHAPDNAMVHTARVQILRNLGRADDVIAACREALCAVPYDATIHLNLGLALAERTGAEVEAKQQLLLAAQLGPEVIENLEPVAWNLATHPSAAIRDADAARHVAGKVIELTKDRSYVARLALAAAEADLGQFDAAVQSAGIARAIATAADDANRAHDAQELAAWFRAGRPYYRPIQSSR